MQVFFLLQFFYIDFIVLLMTAFKFTFHSQKKVEYTYFPTTNLCVILHTSLPLMFIYC